MKKLDNFISALTNLKQYSSINYSKYDDIERELMISGLLNHYEKTFELSWNLMKQVLYYEGIGGASSGSPLEILKLSYKYGLIDNADAWKKALKDRNELSHIYNPDDLDDKLNVIISNYIPMFDALLNSSLERLFSLYENELIPRNDADEAFISLYNKYSDNAPEL